MNVNLSRKEENAVNTRFAVLQENDTYNEYLDTNTKTVRRFSEDDILQELKDVIKYKEILWKMRNVSGLIKRECEEYDIDGNYLKARVSFCGRKIDKQDSQKNILVVKGQETGNLFYNGLLSCGSVWRCPVCSYKITKTRQIELFKLLSFYQENGYKMSFVTLTVRHNAKDSLKSTLENINDNFRKLQRQRSYLDIKGCYLGMVKAVEITYSPVNGWHPHLHIIFIHHKHITHEFAGVRMRKLISLFCKRKGVDALVRSQKYKPVYDELGIKDYVTKWDTSRELTEGALKLAKKNSITPFGMLRAISEKRSNFVKYRDLFREYIDATFGKTHLLVSPAIREVYKIVNPETKRDDEVVKDEVIGSLVLSLAPTLWLKIRNRSIAPKFLSILDKKGYNDAVEYLESRKILVREKYNEDLKIPEIMAI